LDEGKRSEHEVIAEDVPEGSLVFQEGVQVIKKVRDQDKKNERDATKDNRDDEFADEIAVEDPHGLMAEGSGQGQKSHAEGPGRLEGFCGLFKGGSGREDIVDQKNRASLDLLRVRHPEHPVEVEPAAFPTEETLREGGVFLDQRFPF